MIKLKPQLVQPVPFPLLFWEQASIYTVGRVRLEQPLVFVLKDMYRQVNAHAEEGLKAVGGARERGGALFGHYCHFEEVLFFLVLDAEPCGEGNTSAVHVEFPLDFWERLDGVQEKRCPDLLRLGTYHSHPGYSVRPSETDRRTFMSSFNRPHHLALIVDPTLGEARFGFSLWHQGVLQPPTGCFVFSYVDDPDASKLRHRIDEARRNGATPASRREDE